MCSPPCSSLPIARKGDEGHESQNDEAAREICAGDSDSTEPATKTLVKRMPQAFREALRRRSTGATVTARAQAQEKVQSPHHFASRSPCSWVDLRPRLLEDSEQGKRRAGPGTSQGEALPKNGAASRTAATRLTFPNQPTIKALLRLHTGQQRQRRYVGEANLSTLVHAAVTRADRRERSRCLRLQSCAESPRAADRSNLHIPRRCWRFLEVCVVL